MTFAQEKGRLVVGATGQPGKVKKRCRGADGGSWAYACPGRFLKVRPSRESRDGKWQEHTWAVIVLASQEVGRYNIEARVSIRTFHICDPGETLCPFKTSMSIYFVS